ncbi:hypothetical protein CVT26_006667 [Gymnopilus dilepis]|uniref:Conidiation protein 6 n=1 Tax=Gymnopilus dilepis TaxID=231916 RepID=A0A409Y2K9_9AGAR|nr:hypothetical protein CVT26_006667 [Gymnopilus dilepis]
MSDSHPEKNPERVIAGLKAAVHNPTVSEAARTHAKDRLREMGVDTEESVSHSGMTGSGQYNHPVGERDKIVIEEPAHHSRARHETGVHHHSEDKAEEGNMLRGYKAALHNPNVSQEAKDNARRILKEHGALNE